MGVSSAASFKGTGHVFVGQCEVFFFFVFDIVYAFFFLLLLSSLGRDFSVVCPLNP